MKPSWGDGWTIGLRVWVERDGLAILGQGRLELLEEINRWHSISAAARHMGMSYRRAWELVQSINAASGESLVQANSGGSQGGGAELTEMGRWAIGIFRAVDQQVRLTAGNALPPLVQPSTTSTLHLAAAASLEEVLREVLGAYALQEPAVQVQAVFGASDELANHIISGAPADVFVTADLCQLERLRAAGLTADGTGVLLATTSLAAITQRDRNSTVALPAHLARPEAGSIALARPESPAGRYTQAYLESTGLLESIAGRAVWVENSRAVVAAIRARQADVGLVYASDAFRAEGCRILFQIRRLPMSVQFSAATVSRSSRPAEAKRLLDFLASVEAAACFRRFGFAPAFKRKNA
jgi:molybdenum ABC transporter molybdate-binding protein